MSIQLQQFIEQKKVELEQSGKYKHVSIHSKDAVMLSRNCIGDKFLSTDTPYTQNGHEVKHGEFPDIPTVPFSENATKVIFEVIEKRKRKPTDVTFYFLWESENMKVYQQNIFGGEDEIIQSVPVIVLKHKEKEGRYLAADIEVADFSDPDGDVTMDDIQNAFIIVRNDRQKPGQTEIDEVVAHSEAHKAYMYKNHGDKAFISYDVAKWLETYEPVNIDMPVAKFNEAAYTNDWEPVAII